MKHRPSPETMDRELRALEAREAMFPTRWNDPEPIAEPLVYRTFIIGAKAFNVAYSLDHDGRRLDVVPVAFREPRKGEFYAPRPSNCGVIVSVYRAPRDFKRAQFVIFDFPK